MALKVYGRWRSPFVKTVIFTLYEKNVDFELVHVETEDTKLLELLRTKNPFGQMPAFEDGDFVLWESRAIAKYIVSKYANQGTPLVGSTLKEQALVNLWIDAESQTLFPVMRTILVELVYKIVPNKALLQTNLEKLGKTSDVYEGQLSKHKYLAGDFFSLADLCHAPMIHFFMCIADPVQRAVFTSRLHVHAWYQDMSGRPAWQKILQIPDSADWSEIKKE